ncbi:MAG: hypothetical protein ASARMPREDX12_008697 [Alectoria sarmentosa]|nr:MAG: hypothetical protein ASARMPREDX12_008697 [Alectoria sarmentosa]
MDYHTNRPVVLLGVLWAQTTLAIIFTVARFYARLLEPGVGWDDWTMLIALFLEYAATSILSRAVHFGLGSHQETLSPESARQALEFLWIYQPVQVTSTIIARISVAIFVIRLFPTKKAMKKFLITLTTFNAAVGIAGFTLIFTQCSPPQKLWNDKVEGHCINSDIQRDMAMFKASISAFSDLATAVWPITIVWTLHMKLQGKVFLGTLFALTLVAMVCCVVEVVYLTAQTVRIDETCKTGPSCTTVNVLIIVGSMPTFPPLFRRFSGSKYSRRSSGNRWPTQKRYTHPLEDTTIDVYPLRERDASTNVSAIGTGEGLEEHAIGGASTARFSGDGWNKREGIQKTTEFDVEY